MPTTQLTKKKPKILIIDGYNMFIRNFVVDPSICAEGSPCGGTKGFMKSLQKISRETKPHQIIVVWDGAGGSKRKRKINADYKEGRAPIKLNRSIHNLTDEEEKQNKVNQFVRLADYLNNMPLIQFMFENVEADDVIARLCSMPQLRGNVKIILSSDKDFIQLCDDETVLMRPIQKEVLNEKRIVQEYGIHPLNFALARAIAGDKSDNLDGIRGVGLPTISKRLPFLSEAKSHTIDDVIQYCDNHKEEFKAYADIASGKDIITLNYRLMQLYSPAMSPTVAKVIKDTIENFQPMFNQTYITTKMIQDGFSDYNWESLFQTFRFMIAESKKAGD